MNKRIQRLLEQVSLEVLVLAVLFLVSLFIFAYIAHEAVYEQEDVFDARVHAYLLAHTTPLLIEVARGFTFLGSSLFLLPTYLLLISISVIFKRRHLALNIFIVALSSFLMMQLLK